MTVGEYFEAEKVTMQDVEDMSEESEYWASASNFTLKTWVDDIEGMSAKQVNWLSKIRDDLIERRIRSR